MKTLTCRQMGGMCDTPIIADNYDEMMAVGMKHVEDAHPDMATNIKNMAKDDPLMVKWEADFKKTWAETPDM